MIQKARVQNDKAVLEEERQNTDANYDNQKKRKHYLERKDQEAQELEFKGIDKEFGHLLKTQRQRTEEED
jgi:calcium/calmodulin-dependent protein kinase (CaM kinase) II/peptidyl-prolyl isomerase G (cyclophilin G)